MNSSRVKYTVLVSWSSKEEHVRCVDGVLKTVTLTDVLLTVLARVSAVHLVSIWQDRYSYRRHVGDRGEGEGAEASADVDLNKSFYEDFLWTEADDAEGAREDIVLATRSLVSPVGHEVILPKK